MQLFDFLFYVSLPPGAGKTNAALALMSRHVRGRSLLIRGTVPGIDPLDTPDFVFYVAPTKHLLQQTHRRLVSKLKGVPALMPRLRIAYSDNDNRGDSVSLQLDRIFDGKHNDGREGAEWGKHCVLFLTHSAFLAYLGQYPEICKRALVLFDESGKWVLPSKDVIILDDDTYPYFNSVFKADPVENLKGFRRLRAIPVPENQKAKLLTKGSATQFSSIDRIHADLLKADTCPRSETYIYATNAARHQYINVTLPSYPFKGFYAVYVLSADFETSEMHRFMIVDNTPPKNVSIAFMNEFSKDGYLPNLDKSSRRFEAVTLIPLLHGNEVMGVSKYRSGYPIVPESKFTSLGALLDELEVDGHELGVVMKRYATQDKNPLTPRDKKVLKALEAHGCILDHHSWMMEQARAILNGLEPNIEDQRILTFVNDGLDKDYIACKDLQLLSHGETEGDNRWYEHNRTIFFAATNPNSRTYNLLKWRLRADDESGEIGSAFDIDRSYSIDRAIQASGRGANRDPNATCPVYIVVANTYMAEAMQRRMSNGRGTRQAKIDYSHCERLGDYTLWSASRYKKEQEAERRAKKPPVEKRLTPTPEEAKELLRLRVARNRATKSGKEERVAELNAEIEALQQTIRARG